MSELLPAGAYLAWRYVDARRDIDRRQVYHEDGRVEAIEGDESSELCRFTPQQVERAKAAITESGLPDAGLDPAAATVHDAAPLTYAWRVADSEGSLTNPGYPQTKIPAVERLDAVLAELEEAAGGWPLLAEE